MNNTSDQARAALSAAAEREDQAERAYRAALATLQTARAQFKAARKTYDDTVAAEEFNRAHPALFGTEDVASVLAANGLVYSDADPGL